MGPGPASRRTCARLPALWHEDTPNSWNKGDPKYHARHGDGADEDEYDESYSCYDADDGEADDDTTDNAKMMLMQVILVRADVML